MMPINRYNQFITSNQNQIVKVVTSFMELNRYFGESLVLNLDSQGWEVFDCNIPKTIIRHEFKHTKALVEDMRRLLFAKVDFILGFEIRSNKSKKNQRWAYKSLLRYYSEIEIYKLTKIFGHEQRYEIQDMENFD